MSSNPVKPPLVLLDANVIIEAHELGLWHGIVAFFEVMVPAVVARHEAKYFVVGGHHNPIQLASLIAQNKVKELQADLRELSELMNQFDPLFSESIDPGEQEALALMLAGRWGEWISRLERLALKTLRDPQRVLAVLADMKPMSPIQSVSLEEVRTVLQRWLVNVQPEPPVTRYGRVFVGPPAQARGRSFEVVFLPGLAERMFPQKLREDPLFLDKLRKEVSSELPLLADRSQQERLLLQVAVGAARSKLYVSYARVEIAEARPRVPSFYAIDVVRSITGRVPNHEHLAREAERVGDSRLAWPAPHDPRQAIDDSEYDLAVLLPLLNASRTTRKARLAYVMNLNQQLARSLRSRWARWNEKWSPQDGLCKKSQAVEPSCERNSDEQFRSIAEIAPAETRPCRRLTSHGDDLHARDQRGRKANCGATWQRSLGNFGR